MRMAVTALLLFALAMPAFAHPERVVGAPGRARDYNYFTVGYQYADLENASEAADGVAFDAVFQVNSWFHGFVSSGTAWLEDEEFGIDLSGVVVSLGPGVHAALAERVSVYARAGYVWNRFEITDWHDSYAETIDGYGLSAGIRASPTSRLETVLSIGLTSIEDESATGYGAGILFGLTGNMALGVGVSLDDEAVTGQLGIRYYFSSIAMDEKR